MVAVVTSGCSGSASRPAVPSKRARARVVARQQGEQLQAHLGVGVPAGWNPVDEGEARVWVPSAWSLEGPGGCVGRAAGVVGLGPFDQTECGARAYPNEPRVAIAPWPSTHAGVPLLTIHGYRVYNADHPYRPSAAWNVYDVPQLRVQVAVLGALGRRVLDTLGPSASNIALDSAYRVVPADWRTVHADGLSVSIPPTWASIAQSSWSCEGWADAEPALFLVKPDVSESCGGGVPPVQELDYGAVVFLTPANPNAPTPAGRVLTTVHHGSTAIAVYADHAYALAFDLVVRRTGSKVTHVITLGLGPDGRVAAGVLASIHSL